MCLCVLIVHVFHFILYRKCKYNATEYTIGDHVMIANSEADDPESISHCYIASLIYMYEMSEYLHIFLLPNLFT